jgi:hypothetical protein
VSEWRRKKRGIGPRRRLGNDSRLVIAVPRVRSQRMGRPIGALHSYGLSRNRRQVADMPVEKTFGLEEVIG